MHCNNQPENTENLRDNACVAKWCGRRDTSQANELLLKQSDDANWQRWQTLDSA